MAVLTGGVTDDVTYMLARRGGIRQDFPNVTVDARAGLLAALPGVSQAWLDAAAHSQTVLGRSARDLPVLLARFVTLNRLFGTGPVVDSDVTVELLIAPLESGGFGTVSVDLDELSDQVRLSGATLRFISATTVIPTFASGLTNALVTLLYGFQDLPLADFLPLFTGVIDRYQVAYGEGVDSASISLIDQRLQNTRNLSTPIGQQYFPGTPPRAQGKNIPVLVGTLIDIPTLPVLEGPATGTLLQGLESADTVLILKEFGQPFPESGAVLVDTEAMTYSARALVNARGTTGLQLSGLVRGTPTDHPVGTVVVRDALDTLTRHIIGYGPVVVNEVRYAGEVLVPVTDYTIVTLQADRDVTAIEVDFSPPDDDANRITVSVNAPNINTAEEVANGEFETGDDTGWTPSANATVNVDSTAPVAFEGTYRLELTGEQGIEAYEEQDLTLVPDERYDFSLWYRTVKATSLLSNASFEADPLLLDDWSTAALVNASAHPQTGFVAAGLQSCKAEFLAMTSLLANYLLNSFPTGWTVTVDTGNTKIAYGMVDSGLSVRSTGAGFTLTFYQDVTTEVGQSYAFACKFVTVTLEQFAQNGTSDILSRVGTPADDEAYLAETATGQSHTYLRNFYTGTGLFNQAGTAGGLIIPVGDYTATQTFIAQTTTTRVTLSIVGTLASFATLSDVRLVPIDTTLPLPRAVRRHDQRLQLEIIGLNRPGESTRNVYYRLVPVLVIFWSVQPGYTVRLFQDVVTTPGEQYTFSFAYYTVSDVTNWAIQPLTTFSSIRYAVGVPTDPAGLIPWTETGASHVLRNGVPESSSMVLGRFAQLPKRVITATAALTRVSFVLHGHVETLDESFPSTALAGIFAVTPAPAYLDTADLIEGTGLNQSAARLQIGLPFVESAYVDDALAFSAEWTQHQGSFTPEQATVRIRLLSQYTDDVFPVYFDAVSVRSAFSFSQNEGGNNPIDAILYMLNTFRPGFTYDEGHFLAARALLADWKFGAYLTDPGDLETRLQRMAFQCKSLLQRNVLGAYDITVLDNSRPVVFELTLLNIVDFALEPGSGDRAYTHFNLYFAAKTGGGQSPNDFAGVTFATPTATSHPTGDALVARCADAYALYGGESRLDYFSEWIQEFETANKELEWLVTRFTQRQDRVVLTTFLNALPLKVGSRVRVIHPALPLGGRTHLGEVVGWHPLPQRSLVEVVIALTELAPDVALIGETDRLARRTGLTLSAPVVTVLEEVP